MTANHFLSRLPDCPLLEVGGTGWAGQGPAVLLCCLQRPVLHHPCLSLSEPWLRGNLRLPASLAPVQRLCLAGAGAASVKFMPVRPHARDSLCWLWSVVRLQGLHNLFGLRWVGALGERAECIGRLPQRQTHRTACKLWDPRSASSVQYCHPCNLQRQRDGGAAAAARRPPELRAPPRSGVQPPTAGARAVLHLCGAAGRRLLRPCSRTVCICRRPDGVNACPCILPMHSARTTPANWAWAACRCPCGLTTHRPSSVLGPPTNSWEPPGRAIALLFQQFEKTARPAGGAI